MLFHAQYLNPECTAMARHNNLGSMVQQIILERHQTDWLTCSV